MTSSSTPSIWTILRDYFDLRVKEAPVLRPLLDKFLQYNRIANAMYLVADPRVKFVGTVIVIAVLLLMTHSGGSLSTLIGVLLALLILVGWGVFAFVDDAVAHEAVVDEHALDPMTIEGSGSKVETPPDNEEANSE